MNDNKIAIIWDIENVTPSRESLFIGGLLEYSKNIGTVSAALAIGNWTGKIANTLAVELSEKGFELIHLPQPDEREKRKKNSSDFVLIAKATEMIFQYPHIQTYVLLTGDIDFRPLLQILKKHGKKIIIVCDSNNASEHLLEFADEYMDYRNLLPADTDNGPSPDIVPVKQNLTLKSALPLLREAVKVMCDKKQTPTPGSVKVRMQLLNENFSGVVDGCSSWTDFIKIAAKQNVIHLDNVDQMLALSLPVNKVASNPKSDLPKIIQLLVEVLRELSPEKKWISFSQVNNALMEKKIDYKKYNYSLFKQLIVDTEKRGLVEMKNQNLVWRVRLR